jgi:asparagine synthase (glutamine-hydrolysing)
MCGIAGIISKNYSLVSTQNIKCMTDAIVHRGPDGEGQFVSTNGNVGLGHRRLSIIDLSTHANQPMHYLHNKYTIVFNGEIYNYIELKETLVKQGYTFTTQSDTEVLMALYDRDKENCLQLLDGMFSFVIYDTETNQIFFARDRFGEKPFFYSLQKDTFYFGSEIKSIWAAGVPKQVNQSMLFNYISYGLLFNTNDATQTFFDGITNLPHSHFGVLDVATMQLQIKQYYKLETTINTNITFDKAKEQFRELFYTSLTRRQRSDVPIGSSLSGGLDSSLIVCAIDKANKNNSIQQNTFSAVFPGFEKDESNFIKIVTDSTNVKPYYVVPNDDDMLNAIEKLCYHQEEPYGSASIFAQYTVMQLAKENNVTVLLDGQGADEMLAGYHRFFPPYLKELKATDANAFQQAVATYQTNYNKNPYNETSKWKGFVKQNFSSQMDGIRKLRERYLQHTEKQFTSDFFNANIKTSKSLKSEFNTLNEALVHATFSGFAMQELLRYADRNSMAHSREVRLPFLFHELVEFVISLPPSYKINNGWTKYIMRESFADVLPAPICWRKDKIGYEPPQAKWMQSAAIKDDIGSSRKKLVQAGILNKQILNKAIGEESASERAGNEWRHWMAGKLIK